MSTDLKVLPPNQRDLLQLSANKKLQATQVCGVPEREASLSLIRLLLLSLLLSGLAPACALFLFLDLLQSLHMTWKQTVKLYEAICACHSQAHNSALCICNCRTSAFTQNSAGLYTGVEDFFHRHHDHCVHAV